VSNLVEFSRLGGVPVKYRKQRAPSQLQEDFLAVLDRCFSELWKVWAIPGKPQGESAVRILSAGAYAVKKGRHGTGEAFDLDGFELGDGRVFRLRKWGGWRKQDPRLVVALEAHLRLHIPQVLGPSYDWAHRDHWHLDNRAAAQGYQHTSRADRQFTLELLRYGGQEAWEGLLRGCRF
jgi:hypothetical protein